MRKINPSILLIVFLISCSRQAGRLDVPASHFPQNAIPKGTLSSYLLAYCWQSPDGRISRNNTKDKEVSVVVSKGDGTQLINIRNPGNTTTENLSDFYIYKSGCVEYGDDIRYIGNAITLRPNVSQLITFTSGSDINLRGFEFYSLQTDLQTAITTPIVDFQEYVPYFTEPKGIFWSSDGSKFATLGRDALATSSNLWVYDVNKQSFYRITSYKELGEWIANASWSRDGDMMAIGLGEQSGIGIIEFSNSKPLASSYTEFSSLTDPDIGQWPYVYKNLLQLTLKHENISFNRYVFSTSQPVWINNTRIIFTAADKDGYASLYIVDKDGNQLMRFAENLSGNVFMPTLSPDEKTLAFVRYPSWKNRERVEIGLIDLTTKEITSLAVIDAPENNDELLISGMAWSPDGNYLSFASNQNGQSDIYIVSADGNSWFNLTEDIDGNAVSPIWIPEP